MPTREDRLASIVRSFGRIERIAYSDAITADGERVSCTELRVRLNEGASLEELVILLRMNGFVVEGFSKRGLKARILIS
ncbi:MAG: hypothetical protein BA066_06090 [Candidatus Korarchaeota archaeon NZ13-K]|nr:MAG: hypothetical protein BA066_06090 [Candidatus Korarchaeota archaeon NZ13-K]